MYRHIYCIFNICINMISVILNDCPNSIIIFFIDIKNIITNGIGKYYVWSMQFVCNELIYQQCSYLMFLAFCSSLT